MATETLTAPWPAGVTARYLTVGGATVDIDDASGLRTVTCSGCTEKKRFSGSEFRDYYTEEYSEARALEEARRWAQAHAATCRAMPKPNA